MSRRFSDRGGHRYEIVKCDRCSAPAAAQAHYGPPLNAVSNTRLANLAGWLEFFNARPQGPGGGPNALHICPECSPKFLETLDQG